MSKRSPSFFIKYLLLFPLLTLVVIFLANYIVFAWSEPTMAPPQGGATNTGFWTVSGNNISNNNTGNVGIGMAPGSYKLNINGQANAVSGLCINGDCKANWSSIYTAGTGMSISGSTINLNLASANTWTAAQTFNANTNFPGSGIWNTSGNVGIGDNSPDSSLKLDVEGNIGATQYCDQNGGNCKTISDIIGVVPVGMISAFYLSSCPLGWVLANGSNGTPDLRGAFIRGMYGNQNGRDAARALGSYQTDDFKSHSHTVTEMIANNSIDGVDSATVWSGEHHNETRNSGLTGGTETRPKNVALIYCMKQ